MITLQEEDRMNHKGNNIKERQCQRKRTLDEKDSQEDKPQEMIQEEALQKDDISLPS